MSGLTHEQNIENTIGYASHIVSILVVYYNFIHSNTTYGLSVWGPLMAKTCLNRIQILQKKSLRVIDNAKYNDSTAKICKKYEILPFAELLNLECAKI